MRHKQNTAIGSRDRESNIQKKGPSGIPRLSFFFLAIGEAKDNAYNSIYLDLENYALEEAYAHNMNNKDKRDVKKIIYEYFEFIESEWLKFQKEAGQ